MSVHDRAKNGREEDDVVVRGSELGDQHGQGVRDQYRMARGSSINVFASWRNVSLKVAMFLMCSGVNGIC